MKIYIVVMEHLHCDYMDFGSIEKIFMDEEKAEEYAEKCEKEKTSNLIYFEVKEKEIES